MTPERWARLRGAIESALTETMPERQEAALGEACAGDPALLSEARSILRAARSTHDFLGAPARLTGEDAGAPVEDWPTLLGRTLGHYQIQERLGAGGMGEVFRARDLALGRESAVKVLPRLVRPELRRRLLREAEVAARLQHPSIATFFEAGEDQGEAFIAMEFVQGQTLRARLRKGPLSFDESLSLASCLLGALGHAHAAGLLHRDIKPENVMVTGPRSAKLLDFGIACGLAVSRPGPEPEAALTVERAAVVGTVGYMSPEQLRGEALDARSDLFQVAIVLYECLTGQPAFGGSSPVERAAATLVGDVDLTVLAGRGLPPGLGPILARALSRDRERRYPTATAFLRDLAALQEGRVEAEPSEILAVVDFENVGRDPEVDWLGAGIAEALVSDLARVNDLAVLPRPRVARALATLRRIGSDAPELELGLMLGCGWVLTGGYQKAGTALRLTSRVTDVYTRRATPLEKVDGTLDEIFDLQDRLARVVAAHLRVKAPVLTGRKEASEFRAYELVTRAKVLVTQFRRETLEQAIDLLEDALRLDAGYAPAHAELAHAYDFHAIATTNAVELENAIHHADRAIALDPQNGQGPLWKGYALWRQERWNEAAPVLRRAVELAPNDALAHYFLGVASFLEGAKQEALPFLQRSLELEPLNAMGWLALGADHLALLNLAEANYAFTLCVGLERKEQRVWPTAGVAAFLAEVLRMEGHLEEARRRALEGIEAAEASDHPYRDTFRAYGLCVLGRIALQQRDLDAARAAYGQVIAQLHGRTRPRSCGHLMVQALAGLGRAGDASAFERGFHLFQTRHTWNFERFNGCLPEQGLLELARAAHALGRGEEAQVLLARAREAGSLEPLEP